MKKNTIKEAFTLIELLVVIAIIGILAGLLFPAIQGAILSANGVKVGNSGKSVVTGIISANTEREAMSKSSVWPTQAKNWATSNEYFAELLDKSILDLSVSTFAGAGVGAAKDVDALKTSGCIWNMMSGIEGATDEMPFMYTRNFDGLTDTDVASDTTTAQQWDDRFDSTIKPFGDKMVVVVSKGSAMTTIKKKYVDNQTFMNGATNASGVLKIVKASTDTAAGGEAEF